MTDFMAAKHLLEDNPIAFLNTVYKLLGKLHAVIGLDAFYRRREGCNEVLQERAVAAVLFKNLYKSPAGVFIGRGVY